MVANLNIKWSERAEKDLDKIYKYLLEEWSCKEADTFIDLLEEFLKLIQRYPEAFVSSAKIKNCRLGLIHRNVSAVYTLEEIQFLLFHTLITGQNPAIDNFAYVLQAFKNEKEFYNSSVG
ncbi:hypothetical protein BH09BAC5_BH09BAC5_11890 [soil metagenome]